MENNIVLAMLAHVDSGKTTLSEAMLYLSGSIRKLGRVDHKDAFLDTYSMEKDRGITIFSKQAMFGWKDLDIALLDTPGHVDFSAEMERTLQVLDYAVLVVSGPAGVQSHTETVWRLLQRYDVPVFIFVNKMDIGDCNKEDIMSGITERFGSECVDFSAEKNDTFFENIAVCDEEVLEKYMDGGNIDDDDIKKLISERRLFPCYFGSALKLDGVGEILDGLERYTLKKEYPKEFGAKVYKVSRDDKNKRLTYLKVTGGVLKSKMYIEQLDEKADQLRIYSGNKFMSVDEVRAGRICAVTGFEKTYPGMGIGIETNSDMPVLEPVMTYKVTPQENDDIHKLYDDMKTLEQEEPGLHVVWNEELQEIHTGIMGEVQIDVLKNLIWDRFHTRVEFGEGSIVYKETIASTVEGVGHFEPLRHYAEVHLKLEPGEPDSGIMIETQASEDKLDKNWQRLIMTHIDEREHPGVLTGSSITDIKITLMSGRAHEKHTEGGDFRQATYRAIRQGLMQAENVLLEPYYSFRLEVPADSVGRAMTDLDRMGAKFEGPFQKGENSEFTGIAPVAQMSGYMMQVNSYTAGKGRLTCTLKGYRPCKDQDAIVAEKMYDPDADINNPTGSVFCAHGSGFYVPWYEVKDYMHLEAAVDMGEDENDSVISDQEIYKAAKIRSGAFKGSTGGSIEEDKELEAIFERTFGKSASGKGGGNDTEGRFGYERKKWSKKPKESVYDAGGVEYLKRHEKSQKSGKQYLLVDGYNIIFSWKELNDLSKENLEAARTKLMDILCNYQGFKGCELILVFDAYKVKGNPGEVSKYHNINVVYTKEAETADMYIEKVTHEIGKKHNVTVATSDGLEQMIVIGSGAYRMSAREFEQEIKKTEREIGEMID